MAKPRNKEQRAKKYSKYRDFGMRLVNKLKRLNKHLKDNPNDQDAIQAIKNSK